MSIESDAHLVRNLYRHKFASASKNVVRGRVIALMRAAGVKTVLDLWGGGVSALALVAAGFRVISVDDGSMELKDSNGHVVSPERKQRALEYAGAEGGYEIRFGNAEDFAAEADGAYLDFCGPWSENVGETIAACQHMKVIVVTLLTGHDINTKATNQRQRLLAYLAWLKDAYRPKPTNRIMGAGNLVRATPCRLIAHYRSPSGQPVLVFLLSQSRVPIQHLSESERRDLNPDYAQRQDQRSKVYQRERFHSDPEYRARRNAYRKKWRDEHRERVRAMNTAAQRALRLRKKAANGGQSVPNGTISD